jgi:hypothetical protein
VSRLKVTGCAATVFLVIVAVVAVVADTAARFGDWGGPDGRLPGFRGDLVRAAQQAGDGGEIDLAEVQASDWERVCLFGAYVSNRTVGEVAGVEWPEHYGGLWYDEEWLLVFVKEEAVANWAEILIGEPTPVWLGAGTAGCHSRDAAKFAVEATYGTDGASVIGWTLMHAP